MQKKISGKIFVLGDNIDTDQIIPASHLVYSLSDPEERRLYGKYALSGVPIAQSGLPKGNVPFIQEGKDKAEYALILGGKNFGCGSSREHAPFALREAGIQAVVAESYARIFYRNSINGGYLIPFETPKPLLGEFQTGDEAELDTSSNTLTNRRTGKVFQLLALGDVAPILDAGDIFSYAKKEGMIR